jgi:acyl carrier protein
MVPAQIVRLDAMPLTPNRKIDRNALPEPEQVMRQERVAPATPAERTLAAIWQDVLGVPEIGATDNFFELGGHSLVATRVVARTREQFRVDLPLRSLFEAPTLADFARAVVRAPTACGEEVALQPRGEIGPQLLSFAQERLWFFARLDPDAAIYNIAGAVRLTGDLDIDALRRSFDRLVVRHHVLRTHFWDDHGEPRQGAVTAVAAALAFEDLAHLPAAAREQVVRVRADEEAQRPFDLAAGPLIRIRLLRLSPAKHVLMLTLHHIAADGWSLRVLVEEFEQLYAAERAGRTLDLPDIPVQYADFAAWQRRRLAAGEMDRQLDYWRRRLGDDLTVLELPGDRPHEAGRSEGARYTFTIDAELTGRLRAFAQADGVTLFMLLLAAFSVVLRQRTGRARVRVGGDVANRNHALLEPLVGFFVNQIVLQVDINDTASVCSLLEQCRAAVVEGTENQDLPFNRLVEVLRPPRRKGRAPFFSIKLIYQDGEDPLPRLPGLVVERCEAGTHAAEIDLVVRFVNETTTIRADFSCPRDLFEPATITTLFAQTQAVLRALLEVPEETPVGMLVERAAVALRAGEVEHLRLLAPRLEKRHRARAGARPGAGTRQAS